MNRCSWVNPKNPLYLSYHDEEWGRPVHEDQALFELLCLETYQAGLSWETVLTKRAAFRAAFFDYQVERVARMTDEELDGLLINPNLIRHKAKLYATRTNAQAFLSVVAAYGTFDRYLWSWVEGQVIDVPVASFRDLPSQTELSARLAKDLKQRAFRFVGPICVYSYLQAAGLFHTHEVTCFVRKEKKEVKDERVFE